LGPVADRITVILPWASLLKTVATPEIDSLRHIAGLCLQQARIEIVFSCDNPDDLNIATLPCLYQQAGLEVITLERIPQLDLCAYETTWAKRLAFGRPRDVWRIRCSRGL
jgi:hypothetical protein